MIDSFHSYDQCLQLNLWVNHMPSIFISCNSSRTFSLFYSLLFKYQSSFICILYICLLKNKFLKNSILGYHIFKSIHHDFGWWFVISMFLDIELSFHILKHCIFTCSSLPKIFLIISHINCTSYNEETIHFLFKCVVYTHRYEHMYLFTMRE